MKNWRIKLRAGEKRTAKVKVLRRICQRDALLLFIVVIMIMPLNHVLRKSLSINLSIKRHLMERKKIRMLLKKVKLLIVGNTGNGHHQTGRDERKKKLKNTAAEGKNYPKPNYMIKTSKNV